MTPAEARQEALDALDDLESLLHEALRVKDGIPEVTLHPAIRKVVTFLDADLRGALRRVRNVRPFIADDPTSPVA